MKFVQLLIWLLLPAAMFSQQAVFKEINTLKGQGAHFEQMDLFTYQHSDPTAYDISTDVLDKADFIELNLAEIRRAKANKYDQILVEVHGLNGQAYTLELTKTKVLSDNFKLFTSDNPNEAIPYESGLHYKGIVQGDPTSLVAFSLFHEHVTGMIANQAGNYVIAQMQDRGLIHILYNDQDLDGVLPGDCETMDDGKGYKAKDLVVDPNKSPGDCIQIHIEIDDDIVSAKGGGTAATAYIEGMFAQCFILYANDGLTLEISEIFAWTTPSPYSGGSSSAMLSSYQSNTGSFNGDLSHLVSYQASGGIAAGFSGICNSNVDLSKCFSSVDGSYSNVPAFSWSVMVITHEMGHLIGSRHTHACVWNGNSTAIDGCSGSTEGGCALPPNPPEGGTIMSYCHLTSVGINLNLGFGPQPQAVVQNTVINASCLGSCGGPSCNNGIQDGDETGVDCGGSVCQPCPTCTDGIQNGDETGIDCGGSSCPACPPSYCSSTGTNQSYEFIDAVQLTTINNTSGSDGGYGDYTSLIGDIDAGSTYSITLTPGFVGSAYPENWRVWIDYNADYDFDDAGELVAEGASNTTQIIAFTVPGLSSSVITRMRVSMQYNAYPPNCGNFTYGEVEDYTLSVTVPSGPTCTDGIQNGDETGVDCGGATCPACPTCTDGIQNGDETGVDCGGTLCPACPTCTDGIQNGDETDVDCGGSICPPCASCTDGIQNGDETGVDCGGTLCPACTTCTDGIQNGDETGVDCGGATCPACPTCTDGIQNGDETGVDCGGATCPACPTCNDGIQNGDETGVDCGGATCPTCPTCTDGIQNGDETDVDCGGAICPACPTCTDGIQNGDETGVDCGGATCPACPTCTDGIQNGDETDVDCGGAICPACPTCTDGIQNGDETDVDCGGAICPACPTCTDGIQNGNETGVDCGGSCSPCGGGGCTYQTVDFEDFESGWGIWNDGGSDCRKSSKDSGYAYSGNYPVRLRDNTSTSTMTTDNLDLSAYDELTVDFTYIARSMDNSNEDFWLQISTDGGTTFNTIEEWNKGDEFENNIREFDNVVISGPFSTNTKLRFRCDASGNSDWVYLDDIDITGCFNGTALGEGENDDTVIEESTVDIDQFRKVQLFPNPAGHVLNVKFLAAEEGTITATVLDITGNPIVSSDFINRVGANELQIDLDRVGNGIFLLQLSNDSQRVVKRFFVVK